MTDEREGWASPSGGPADGRSDEPPRYGERVPGWTAPSAPPPTSPSGPGAYVPPPRRGLVPLHPLSFGQLLGAAFGVIRWNPKATLIPSLIVVGVQAVLVFGALGLFATGAVDRFERASPADQQLILQGIAGGGILVGLLIIVVSVFTGALLQGLLVAVVGSAAAGQRIRLGAALRTAWRRVLPLIGVAVLLGLLQTVALAVLVGLVLLFGVALGHTVGIVLAVIIGILGGAAYLIAYAFFAVKLATVPSAVVLERKGVFESIRRSWVLMRGAFWRTFGLLALVIVMVNLAAQIVSLPFSLIGGVAGGLLFPNAGSSDPESAIVPALISTVPAAIVSVLVGGIGQVAQVAAVVLVYVDQRMRREGLDLELQRYAEQGGADPFERVP